MKKEKKLPVKNPLKKQIPLIAGILLLMILVSGLFYVSQKPAGSSGLPSEITVSEVNRQRDNGVFILDVRQPEEYSQSHIPGAVLISLDSLESRLGEIPADQAVIVVCRSGKRSAAGRDTLIEKGFTNVTSMAGGMNEWIEGGYPVETGP